MAQRDGRTENHHYVPKMLLRNFSFGKKKKEKIHAYDKHDQRVLRGVNISNMACERNFYDVAGRNGERFSLEQNLSDLESHADGAVKRIVSEQNLHTLSDAEVAWLVLFAAIQFSRGNDFRESIRQIDTELTRKVVALGHDPLQVDGWKPFTSDDEIKAFAMQFMVGSIPDFTKHISQKSMILFGTTDQNPFWISDRPLVLHNDVDMKPYGNIGLAIQGIQIYLPLSPTLLLGWWCPSIIEGHHANLSELKRLRTNQRAISMLSPLSNQEAARELLGDLDRKIETTEAVIKAAETGTVLQSSLPNVEFYNSLQVSWASRFVMSRYDRFDLADRMIRDNPKRKRGIRLTMN